MCKLFIGADVSLWLARTHSLRIDGVATSIRMEEFFWSVLGRVASRDKLTINQLITRLYHESLDADHDLGNFTSFLRVCCGRYLDLMAREEIVTDETSSLADVDVEGILSRESARA
ncbi:ribbon-helix-helix domain-containing protein [bacterium]|nr:ribbon-helix-helix domain-containing protein [bacterium]